MQAGPGGDGHVPVADVAQALVDVVVVVAVAELGLDGAERELDVAPALDVALAPVVAVGYAAEAVVVDIAVAAAKRIHSAGFLIQISLEKHLLNSLLN